jgi:hypothetical protein
MRTHRNYFEIEAGSYFELGLRKGKLFGDFLRRTLAERRADPDWTDDLRRARAYLGPAKQAFPHLIDELQGYAQGAGAPFEDLWLLNIEDEFEDAAREKCTTIVTNGGALIAHNEDWDEEAENEICVLRKTVGPLSTFELYYLNMPGGNSISMNSYGFVHAVNSLHHTDRQVGVPKNLVARWLSETRCPDQDFQTLAKLRRASGYHHCLVEVEGGLWSIECSARRQTLVRPASPFVHTNHFLTSLSAVEGKHCAHGTRCRYRFALANVRDPMPLADVKELCSDTSAGRRKSLFNDRTLARMVIDLPSMTAHVWLRREEAAGWVTYPLDFVMAPT